MNKPTVVQRDRYVITEPNTLYRDDSQGRVLFQVHVQRLSDVPPHEYRVRRALRRVFTAQQQPRLQEVGSVWELTYMLPFGWDSGAVFEQIIEALDWAFGSDPDPAVWGDALDALDVDGMGEG